MPVLALAMVKDADLQSSWEYIELGDPLSKPTTVTEEPSDESSEWEPSSETAKMRSEEEV